MFDMHYDLLTLSYMAKKQNKDINQFIKSLSLGVTANLYFMSKEEIKRELDYPDNINVLEMFKEAKETLQKYNPNTKILYSIEGCDYIKDETELEQLKNQGLNAILLVWNNPNKYGSGNRTNKGLTIDGKKFIKKAIDLGLGIDLSHANEQTFYDIIEIIKEEQKKGKNVICYASHSNIKELQNHPRNLSDNQLETLKEVSGKIGLVAYPSFLTNQQTNLRKKYIEHIIYAVNKMGIDNVMLSSDNMDFIKMFTNNNTSDKAIYPYKEMELQIKQDLKPYFTKQEIEKIMYKNAYDLYTKLTEK